jgi:hypothetical protein
MKGTHMSACICADEIPLRGYIPRREWFRAGLPDHERSAGGGII